MSVCFADIAGGYVRIRIWGKSYDRFLNLCAFHQIRLWELTPGEEGYEAFMTTRDFKKIRSICKKSHARVRIIKRYGLPFFLHKYRRRHGCIFGILSALFLTILLSTRVWRIELYGNLSQTDTTVFQYLDTEGVCYGMARSDVNCKELAAKLRAYFAEFSWVAVELKGTSLSVQVKEGILRTQEKEAVMKAPSDLVSTVNGTVETIYTRNGIPLVTAGDTVQPGMVLVSGAIPIMNDSGEVDHYQYTAADADIIIRMEISYRDQVNRIASVKTYTGEKRKKYLLELGHVLFGFSKRPWENETADNCDLYMTEHQLHLFEQFYFPVYWRIFTFNEYENTQIMYTKEQIASRINANLQYFIENLKEKGVQIFENDVKIEWTEKSAVASGKLMIGKSAVRRVEIVEQMQ